MCTIYGKYNLYFSKYNLSVVPLQKNPVFKNHYSGVKSWEVDCSTSQRNHSFMLFQTEQVSQLTLEHSPQKSPLGALPVPLSCIPPTLSI